MLAAKKRLFQCQKGKRKNPNSFSVVLNLSNYRKSHLLSSFKKTLPPYAVSRVLFLEFLSGPDGGDSLIFPTNRARKVLSPQEKDHCLNFRVVIESVRNFLDCVLFYSVNRYNLYIFFKLQIFAPQCFVLIYRSV